jgi:hypothetical protein
MAKAVEVFMAALAKQTVDDVKREDFFVLGLDRSGELLYAVES